MNKLSMNHQEHSINLHEKSEMELRSTRKLKRNRSKNSLIKNKTKTKTKNIKEKYFQRSCYTLKLQVPAWPIPFQVFSSKFWCLLVVLLIKPNKLEYAAEYLRNII